MTTARTKTFKILLFTINWKYVNAIKLLYSYENNYSDKHRCLDIPLAELLNHLAYCQSSYFFMWWVFKNVIHDK